MRSPLTKPHRITSHFGRRVLGGRSEHHNGIDLVPLDRLHPTDIVAVCPGTVTHVISHLPDSHTGLNIRNNTAGNLIRFRTDNDFSIIYYHLRANSVTVKVGQRVQEGQKVGIMGTTGRSTGIHLHYEIHNPNRQAIDPLPFLEGGKILLPGSASASVPEASDTYTVKPGDSLWAIAQRFSPRGGAGWTELYELNKTTIGSDPNLIHPGQLLVIPESWR